jgi:hypothetical protein
MPIFAGLMSGAPLYLLLIFRFGLRKGICVNAIYYISIRVTTPCSLL